MQTDTHLSMVSPGSVQSLSRPTSSWQTMKATVIKGLQIARRYVPNLIGTFVELAIRVAFFLLLSSAIAVQQETAGYDLSGRDLFVFFQGSLLLFIFTRSTLWGPINAVTNDLYNGTLEYLYSSPGSRYAYYVGTVLADVTVSQVVFLPLYLFLGFTSRAGIGYMLMVLLVCLLVFVTLTAFGVMIGILALLWRQVGSLAQVLGILFEFLGGAYLPVAAFPEPLQYLAYLLPYTWGYDLIRYYSFQGDWQTLLPVWQEWGFLVVYAILYTALSRYLLQRAERLAKRSGLHVI